MGRIKDAVISQYQSLMCIYCSADCQSEKILRGHEEVCIFNNRHSCRNKILSMLSEVCADTMQVFDFGATKHPDSGDTPNFLTPNGNKCSLRERGSSVLRHDARTFMHPEALDEESGLSEYLHLMASVGILYIRHKRNIRHPDDADKTS